MELNKAYWEARYNNDTAGWDIGEVSTPLKNYIEGLSDKTLKILVPGAGNGYEVAYLFHQGFQHVYMLDFAAYPLENFKTRFSDFPKGQLIQDDFFKHEGTYDLIIEQTFFCALDPKLRMDYVKKMHQLLSPGGILAGVMFGVEMHQEGPPFGGTAEEYEYLFEPYFEIEKLEPCYNSIAPRKGRELFVQFRKKENG